MLLAERDQFALVKEVEGLDGADGAEGPARAAVFLVLDTGHGAVQPPIFICGQLLVFLREHDVVGKIELETVLVGLLVARRRLLQKQVVESVEAAVKVTLVLGVRQVGVLGHPQSVAVVVGRVVVPVDEVEVFAENPQPRRFFQLRFVVLGEKALERIPLAQVVRALFLVQQRRGRILVRGRRRGALP